MATLSAHKGEIGRLVYLTYTKAVCKDGAILKNDGLGWKLVARVKAGVDPRECFEAKRRALDEFCATRPAFTAYKHALHDTAGQRNRWKLHAAVELMHDDPDGVWSEVCDGYGSNLSADIDQVSALCALWSAARRERQALKQDHEVFTTE